MRFIILPLLLIASLANASPEEFLQKNPKASRTLETPEYSSMCLAMNGALADAVNASSAKRIKKLNAIIWAFLEGNGTADKVEGLIEASIIKLKDERNHNINETIKSANCENLNKSLIKRYM